ncbi:hypothetical protein HY68_38535 [Streptomyces sp. AcH 505]|nr:hypothetical protein HY68_38535 [Streptomyces sp. AcH 505]
MICGSQDILDLCIGQVQIAAEHDGDLSFGLRLQHLGNWKSAAMSDLHVGEQHTEIGLIDPKLHLNGFCR